MSGIMSEADITAIGGRGYGGLGGGGGIWDFLLATAVLGGDGFGRRKDNCCPPPATCESVNMVDRDVLETANETQEAIANSLHAVEKDIYALGDKVGAGFYALNDKMSSIAYAQQAATESIKNKIDVGNTAILGAIKETAMAQENKAQAAVICAQNEEINRFKIINALKCCDDKKSE